MKLYAYRCRQCGRRTDPVRLVCDRCGGQDFDQEPLEGTVTLLTHTRVHCLPEGIERPYLDFGLVEFENGVRAAGQLRLQSTARIGMKLRAGVDVVRVLRGEEKYGFVFEEDSAPSV